MTDVLGCGLLTHSLTRKCRLLLMHKKTIIYYILWDRLAYSLQVYTGADW